MTRLERLDRFLFQPVTAKGFGLLRIAWASTVFAFFVMQWPDIVADYSNAGLLPATLKNLAGRSEWRFTILDYVQSPSAVFTLYVMFLIALVVCALGVFSRVPTVMSVLLLFSFHERNPLLLGGGDTVLRTVGFLLAIAPSGSAFSLDRRMRARPGPGEEKMPIWPVRLLTWQLVVIYGMSVWSKLLGRSWRNGTAIAIALHHPTYARISPALADTLLPVTPLLTYATLMFEAAWLLLLVPSSFIPPRLQFVQLKRLLIIYGVLFHLAIFILMDVGAFSIAMITSYCGLLTDDDFSALGARWTGIRKITLGAGRRQNTGVSGHSARQIRTWILVGVVLLLYSTAFAQNQSRLTKAYEDVRFKVSYMHWARGDRPASPYAHAGPVVIVFLEDGSLQTLPSGPIDRHHSGEVQYIEGGGAVAGGTLVSGDRLRALIVELKTTGSSRGLQPSPFTPAFPRADATPVVDNDRVIVWDMLYRPDDQLPLMLHEKNSIRVWITAADVDRAYPDQPPHLQERAAGAWEMIKAGVVMSERVSGRPARAVAIELK